MKTFRRAAKQIIAAILISASLAASVYAYSFTDIEGHWSADNVEKAHELGVVSGYPVEDGLFEFRPVNEVSHQEAMAMICNALKSCSYRELNMEAAADYDEVLNSLGFAPWAKSFGGALMAADAVFASDFPLRAQASDPAERQTIGAWAARVLQLPEAPLVSVQNFTDGNTVAPCFAAEVDALYRYGIMSGYTDGSFGPNRRVTRGEFATVCVNMISAVEKLKEASGKNLLADSLFTGTGVFQGCDELTRQVAFSFGGPYIIPEDTSMVLDGRPAAFSDLSSLGSAQVVVSFLYSQNPVLIIQTKPMVEKAYVRSVSTEGDFYVVGVKNEFEVTLSYALPKDSGFALPTVGDNISFIALGAKFLEIK
ncbi:MAG TPA: S-layer homology domain-containing protein [Bacillota bacterium]|nr:S-layer homology domain-containing protein [Bacillota bacterium]